MLYLNRRTHLEAWDIEVQFRRALRRRIGAGAATVSCIALAVLLVASEPVYAQETNPPITGTPTAQSDDKPERQLQQPLVSEDIQQGHQEIAAKIEAILSAEEFGKTKTRTVWQSKFKDDDEENRPRRRSSEFTGIGMLLELAMWILVAALIAAIVVYRDRWLPYFRGSLGHKKRRQRDSGGLLLDDAEMPTDVPTAVRRLWQSGHHLEAASLLYRATLTQLNDQHALKIGEGHTEGDCLRRVRRGASSEVSGYFARITHGWQSIAYAHRAPSDAEMEALCAAWSSTLEYEA